ncbi:hypothetical protein PG994_014007 [Apiospora phragmitis]|uniref:Uncharacterized protein n=1 Tax=Apiospora phragmitis TaxID=2905665 RepID=A0ABR1T4U4_9PEZI
MTALIGARQASTCIMAQSGFGAALHSYPEGGAPARQEQDSTSRMTNLYHKIGQLDPEKRRPLTLIHILVKAAVRDPVIALDLDIAIQGQYLPAPDSGLPMVATQVHPPLNPLRTYRSNTAGPSLAASRDPVPPAPFGTGQKRAAVNQPSLSQPPPRRPREKPANYDRLLKITEHDLGWLENLEKAMERHRSYANRLHVLTVMRNILTSCYVTQPSRVGTYVRHGFMYDEHFARAVQAMTPGQRRKVRGRGRR